MSLRVYNAAKAQILTPGMTTSVNLMIDNSMPSAAITSIVHDGTPVGTCGIVTTGPDKFRFEISALDPQQHLLSWSLGVLWGDNKSAAIAGDSYAAHVTPGKLWGGISGTVPAGSWAATVPGDPTSKRCAHTFVLHAWARTINGYSYLHQGRAHRSITIMLP